MHMCLSCPFAPSTDISAAQLPLLVPVRAAHLICPVTFTFDCKHMVIWRRHTSMPRPRIRETISSTLSHWPLPTCALHKSLSRPELLKLNSAYMRMSHTVSVLHDVDANAAGDPTVLSNLIH